MKKMMALAIGILALIGLESKIYSQSVGINSDGTVPNGNAMLDVSSPATGAGKGLLIPRMTLAQRTNPGEPGGLIITSGELRGDAAQGLMVYQTDGTQGFYYNTSTTPLPSWTFIGGGGGSGTMSLQNADSVAITGGTIDGTAIGWTTRAVGRFVNVGAENVYYFGASNEYILHKGSNSYATNLVVGNGGRNIDVGGENNTFAGASAGYAATTGQGNTAMGTSALYANNTGSSNTAVGHLSLTAQTGASNNTAVGSNTMVLNSTGSENTAVGRSALSQNTIAIGNTAIGHEAAANYVRAADADGYNTAVGYQAMLGTSSQASGNYNTAIGAYSMGTMTLASYNVAVGCNSLAVIYAGLNNTAIGYNAMNSLESGAGNTSVGSTSLVGNVLGHNNTAMGLQALSNTLSDNNTAIGVGAGTVNVSGGNNTFLGYQANCAPLYSYLNNATAIGFNAQVYADNSIVLGNGSITSLFCTGAYAGTSSDPANMVVDNSGHIMRSTSSARYKKDISDIKVDSSKIYDLHPVSFIGVNDNKAHFGLIAEEVAKTIPELADFAEAKRVIPGRTDNELVPDAVKYPLLPVLMLNEMKKLKAENEALKADLKAIKEKLGMQ